MSKGKAKLVNEYVKQARAGIQLQFKARPSAPNSIPDNVVVVGRVRTEDGSLVIARIKEPHPIIGLNWVGYLLQAEIME